METVAKEGRDRETGREGGWQRREGVRGGGGGLISGV